jgi:hypothetical protein
VGGYVINMGQIGRSTHVGLLVAASASALLVSLSSANSQVGGAVQYPPASVGEDAQPPPPARMAPQSMSPRRIDLGFSGSGERPGDYMRAPRSGASTTPPPRAGGR